MRVLVCDPDQVSRNAIRRILRDHPAHRVIAEVADAKGIFEMGDEADLDAVVLAAAIIRDDGASVSRLVRDMGVAVILVAVAADGIGIWSGLSQGISGYLLKDRLATELGLSLTATEAGGIFLSPPLARVLIDFISDRVVSAGGRRGASEIDRRLLPRERETLQRLAAGQSTEQIAAEMCVALSTVRTYVSRVLRKVRVRTRGEAIALAYRTGYYSPDMPGGDAGDFLARPADAC